MIGRALRITALAACFVIQNGFAQDPARASLSADSSTALIGAWLGTTLQVDAAKGVKVLLPEGRDDAQGAEIVSSEPETRSEENGRVVIIKRYTLACFDTGRVAVSLRVRYILAGAKDTAAVNTPALMFTITGIPVDTSQAFRDIKDVLSVPLTFWEIAAYVALMLALLALGWYAWKRYSRRDEPEPEIVEEPEAPPVPAYDTAMRRLRDLEARRVWEQGRHKEYQSELSEIVREYIEGRFHQPALEQTTTEIVIGLARAGQDPALITKLEQALRTADMTKFAKYLPAPTEHALGMSVAHEFVESTRPLEESASTEESANV